jgi:UDP-N-acetylmuramate--alanine ligase
MVGIGGAGMSGIAEVLLSLGYEVAGSDAGDSAVVARLCSLGADVRIGHDAANLGDVQVLVKSTAIRDDNPEVVEARRRGIAVIPRAEMLAELMRLRKGVAIAGTHGKTTTTSLAASIFDEAGEDPTVIIGGRLNAYGTNAHLGKGEYLIAEADESDGSFLCLLPTINVVTNVDDDHLDHYRTREAIDAAFVKFMNSVPFYGVNVVCGDDEGVAGLLPMVKRPVVTYGLGSGNALQARNVVLGDVSRFDVWRRDAVNLFGPTPDAPAGAGSDGHVLLGEVRLPQPGSHNVLNALGAIGAAMAAGVPFSACRAGLAGFGGVGRRFERKGERDGVTVVDDYGHHPAEIKATLACAREIFKGRRLVVAFQPHRFTRTQAHFGEFCKVFQDADQVLLTEIYAASESPIPGVSGQSLAQGMRQVCGTPVTFYQDIEEMAAALPGRLVPGDVLLTLGAGTITKLGPMYLDGGHA